MVGTTLPATELEPGPATSPEIGQRWLLPPPASIDRGMFARALRAAADLWQPRWLDGPIAPLTIAAIAPASVIPDVLEAWRATERELDGMTGDSPHQELLEANVEMLRAMYQRLYVERAGQ